MGSPDTFKIFIGNLSPSATSNEIRDLFSKHGNVVEAVVMSGKNYGFVHMSTEAQGLKAMSRLEGYNLHGQKMSVQRANTTKKEHGYHPHPTNHVTSVPTSSTTNTNFIKKQPVSIGRGVSSLDDFGDQSNNSNMATNIDSQKKTNARNKKYLKPPTPPQEVNVEKTQNFSPDSFINSKSPISILKNKGPSTANHAGGGAFENFHSNLSEAPSENNSNFDSNVDSMNKSLFNSMYGGSNDTLLSSSNNSSERPSPLLISNTPLSYTPEHILYNNPGLQDSKLDNYILSINKDSDYTCSACDVKYDPVSRIPKILSCNHTFCFECLVSITKRNEIKCPAGCHYLTTLSESGVAGLTTNQTKVRQNLQYFSNFMQGYDNQPNRSYANEKDVCLQCLSCPAVELCLYQKHEVVKESRAFDILRPKLQNMIQVSYTTLRGVMAIQASLKERMQYTLHSLNKFSEELKIKIDDEDYKQVMQQSQLKDLTDCEVSMTSTNSIADLLSMVHKVQVFSQKITYQHSESRAKDTINGALDSILLQLKDTALESCLNSLGFAKEEAFSLSSSLRENADKGNFANVLLIYLLCDLLSTRYRPGSAASCSSLLGITQHFQGGATGGGGTSNPTTSSILNNVHQQSFNHLNHPLTNNGDLSNLSESERHLFDINKVLETTEAIESNIPSINSVNNVHVEGSSSNHQQRYSPSIVSSALSLGISNVSLLSSKENYSINENAADNSSENSRPVSYLNAAKKPPKVQPVDTSKQIKTISAPLKSTKFPHCWMIVSVNGTTVGRIIFQLRPDKAPRMCENFVGLCTGASGYGYKGTHFFKSGDGFLVGGDVEHDDGTGGYSIYGKEKFEADLCPLKDDVGMVRFKGIGTSENGRGMVGSQFMIWYTERDFKKFSFSLVFGRVVDGLKIVQDAANHNLHNVAIKVEECGAI